MRIAISITAPKPDASLDLRFGRAKAFAIVDTMTGEQQVINNPAIHANKGAGIQAAEFIVKQQVQAVISGAFGPKACDVLRASNIVLYRAEAGEIDDLVTRLQVGDLDVVENA